MKRFVFCLVIVTGLFVSTVGTALGADAPFVLHVPPLMYHNVQCTVPAGKGAGNFVCEDRFEATLKYFKAKGWTSVTAAQVADAMVNHQCLPPKTFVIIFDDGHYNQYKNAYPLLLKYGYTATFAMIAGSAGKKVNGELNNFTWDQAREMVANGMDIANHTMNHKPIGRLDEAGLDAQVQAAQDLFYRELGFYPKTFVYPYGSVGSGSAPAYLSSRFELAFTDPGIQGYPNGAYESTADPMRALRIRVNRSYTPSGIMHSMTKYSKPCEGADPVITE